MSHKVAPDLQDRMVDVGTLHNLPGNPRNGDVPALAASYDQFGQAKPIVVWSGDTDGEHPDMDGKLVVLDGNHQLKAVRKLEWTHIAVNDMSSQWTWLEAKAYALVANRTSDLGEYDEEKLWAMVSDVNQQDESLVAAAGFDEVSLLLLMAAAEGESERSFAQSEAEDMGGADGDFYANSGDEPEEFTPEDIEAKATNKCPKCEYVW